MRKYLSFADKRRIFLLATAALLLILVIIICAFWPDVTPMPTPQTSDAVEIPVLMPSGQIEQVLLGDFLVGVVAAEMPASFAEQALQAQAVAARTYIVRRLLDGGSKHEGAVVCTDSTCCQAYCNQEQLHEKWGSSFDEYFAKVESAVAETAGQVLYYQSKLVEAPFFSACGGRTENAEDCWGSALPYLISVDCGYCSHASRYTGIVSMSLTAAAEKLQTPSSQVPLISTSSYTHGGRVQALDVGGQLLKGTEVRSLLGLNSAAFTWLIMGESIIFFSVGYGHGVGMCQYGADGMAKAGYSYQQILQHYYTGAEVLPMRL